MDEAEARIWAETKGYHYFETSAQTGEGVSEMFQVWWNIYKHTTSSINCLFDTSFTITSELKHMCLYVGIGPSSFLKSNSVKIIIL